DAKRAVQRGKTPDLKAIDASSAAGFREVDVFRMQEAEVNNALDTALEASTNASKTVAISSAAILTGGYAAAAAPAVLGVGLLAGGTAGTVMGVALNLEENAVRGKAVTANLGSIVRDSATEGLSSALSLGIGGAVAKLGMKTGSKVLQHEVTKQVIINESIAAANTGLRGDMDNYGVADIAVSGISGAIGGGIIDRHLKGAANLTAEMAREAAENIAEVHIETANLSTSDAIGAIAGALSELGGSVGKNHHQNHSPPSMHIASGTVPVTDPASLFRSQLDSLNQQLSTFDAVGLKKRKGEPLSPEEESVLSGSKELADTRATLIRENYRYHRLISAVDGDVRTHIETHLGQADLGSSIDLGQNRIFGDGKEVIEFAQGWLEKAYRGEIAPGTELTVQVGPKGQEAVATLRVFKSDELADGVKVGPTAPGGRIIIGVNFDRAIGRDGIVEIESKQETLVVTRTTGGRNERVTIVAGQKPPTNQMYIIGGAYGPTGNFGLYTVLSGRYAPPMSDAEYWSKHAFATGDSHNSARVENGTILVNQGSALHQMMLDGKLRFGEETKVEVISAKPDHSIAAQSLVDGNAEGREAARKIMEGGEIVPMVMALREAAGFSKLSPAEKEAALARLRGLEEGVDRLKPRLEGATMEVMRETVQERFAGYESRDSLPDFSNPEILKTLYAVILVSDYLLNEQKVLEPFSKKAMPNQLEDVLLGKLTRQGDIGSCYPMTVLQIHLARRLGIPVIPVHAEKHIAAAFGDAIPGLVFETANGTFTPLSFYRQSFRVGPESAPEGLDRLLTQAAQPDSTVPSLAESVSFMEKLARSFPEDRLTLTNLAKAYMSAEKFMEAHQTFGRLLELDPHDLFALGGATVLLLAMDNLEEANQLLTVAVQVINARKKLARDTGDTLPLPPNDVVEMVFTQTAFLEHRLAELDPPNAFEHVMNARRMALEAARANPGTPEPGKLIVNWTWELALSLFAEGKGGDAAALYEESGPLVFDNLAHSLDHALAVIASGNKGRASVLFALAALEPEFESHLASRIADLRGRGLEKLAGELEEQGKIYSEKTPPSEPRVPGTDPVRETDRRLFEASWNEYDKTFAELSPQERID
ncbi:MAG: hypothetical protein Q7T11_09645, partial [Deltaproteobacteria bacterium]|nr:hypothetical protein [Deltaproteobacteria bacterium]